MTNVVVIDRHAPAEARSRAADRVMPAYRNGWSAAPAGSSRESRPVDRPSMWLVGASVDVSGADLELLALLASGMAAPRVARTLAVSDRTVRRRVRAICDAVGVDTAIEAVAWAARKHLI